MSRRTPGPASVFSTENHGRVCRTLAGMATSNPQCSRFCSMHLGPPSAKFERELRKACVGR
eukprot:1414338-Rhodomonas_salina.2